MDIEKSLFVFGGIKDGYNDAYHSYHKKIKSLRELRDKTFVNHLPGYVDKIFLVNLFERWENILNALYEEKLLQ